MLHDFAVLAYLYDSVVWVDPCCIFFENFGPFLFLIHEISSLVSTIFINIQRYVFEWRHTRKTSSCLIEQNMLLIVLYEFSLGIFGLQAQYFLGLFSLFKEHVYNSIFRSFFFAFINHNFVCGSMENAQQLLFGRLRSIDIVLRSNFCITFWIV